MRVLIYAADSPGEGLSHLELMSFGAPSLELQIVCDESTKGPFSVTVERRFASLPFGKKERLVSGRQVDGPKEGDRSRRIGLNDLIGAETEESPKKTAALTGKLRAREITVTVHDRNTGDVAKTRLLLVPLLQHLAAKLVLTALGIPIIWMLISFFDKMENDSGFAFLFRAANILFGTALISILARLLNRFDLPLGGLLSRFRLTLAVSLFLVWGVTVGPGQLLVRFHNTTDNTIAFANGEAGLAGRGWKTALRGALPAVDETQLGIACLAGPVDLIKRVAPNAPDKAQCEPESQAAVSAAGDFDIQQIVISCRNAVERVSRDYLKAPETFGCPPKGECAIPRTDAGCRPLDKTIQLNLGPFTNSFLGDGSSSNSAVAISVLPVTGVATLKEEKQKLVAANLHDFGEYELVWRASAEGPRDTSFVALHWSCDETCRQSRSGNTDVIPIPVKVSHLKGIALEINNSVRGDRLGTLTCRRAAVVDSMDIYPVTFAEMTIASLSLSSGHISSLYEKTAFEDGRGWICLPVPAEENSAAPADNGRAKVVVAGSTHWKHPYIAFPPKAAPRRIDIYNGDIHVGSSICSVGDDCKESLVFERVDLKGKADRQMQFRLSKGERRWTSDWIWEDASGKRQPWICRCDDGEKTDGEMKIDAGAGSGLAVWMDPKDPRRIGEIEIRRSAPTCYFSVNGSGCPNISGKEKKSCAPPVPRPGSRCPGTMEYHGCDC